jgi:FemAB family
MALVSRVARFGDYRPCSARNLFKDSHMIAVPAAPQSEDSWQFQSTEPAQWAQWVKDFDGGFFQAPPALESNAPAGQPLYCTHRSPEGVDGIAIGVRHACSLSREARHVYFPAPPRVRSPERASTLLRDLFLALRAAGAAEIVMDSFDAQWTPTIPAPTNEVLREEFVVPLDGTAEERLARCSANHRRRIRHGDRAAWMLRSLTGETARTALAAVQAAARERAAEHGRRFRGDPVVWDAGGLTEDTAPWGATVYAGWDGDRLLGAMLVGWAGRRAFYLVGGCTPAGYEAGAAHWIHWQIATTLSERGYTAYNLGGVRVQPNVDEESGLRQFKIGFGPTIVACYGATWRVRPIHVRTHAATRLLAGWLGQ